MNSVLAAALIPLAFAGSDSDETTGFRAPEFEAPKAVLGGESPIRTEAPGYAAPELFDINGDGRKDLVVGQFADGKIAVYAGQDDGSFGERSWLQADGKVAEVPGVW